MDGFMRHMNVFAGRKDIYALGEQKPDNPFKYSYNKIDGPVTAELLRAHLRGERCVAIYPIVDGKAKWFAVDIDGPKDENKRPLADAFEISYKHAMDQYHRFSDAGFSCYLERSRSGTGCHIWGFLEEWLDVARIKDVIEPLLVAERQQNGFDMIYPAQEVLEPGKPGSNLTLPYYNHKHQTTTSTFIDPYTRNPIPYTEFIEQVRFNKTVIIEKLEETEEIKGYKRAKTSRKLTGTMELDVANKEKLLGALKLISPYGCKFMRHCWENRETLPEPLWEVAISQCTAFEYGREFAHALSRDYPNYSVEETDDRYNRKLSQPIYSCQYIQDNWPSLACKGCTCRAPFKLAERPLISLVEESPNLLEILGDFHDDVRLIEALNSGEEESGISWGIEGMDTVTRLRPNELVVVGGLPSIGKTWFLVESALQIARQGAMSMVFSGETSRRPLRQRLLARQAEIDLERLRGEHPVKLSVSDLKRIREAGESLKQLNIYTDFNTLSPEGILFQVERTLLGNNIPLTTNYVILYDYLQFGSGVDELERHMQIGQMAREYKYLSKVLERPVVIFSQLRRGLEKTVDERPTMADFADSSGIERNMDTGIMIYGERAGGPYAGRWIDFVKQREGRANVRLHYLLHQGYGRWEFTDSKEVQDVRPNLMDDT